jgi:hypothetical protein
VYRSFNFRAVSVTRFSASITPGISPYACQYGVGSRILWLLIFGLFGVGALVDLILIASGKFTDKERKPVLVWTID